MGKNTPQVTKTNNKMKCIRRCFYTQQILDFGFLIPDDFEIFRQQRT